MMLAFLLALTATLGALFIGEVMGQTPCTLCWYQRIAMFPLTAILGVALHEGSDEVVRILEAARRQEKFEPVLDALFKKQPEWAIHGAPDLDRAWRIAGAVGPDLEKARLDRLHPNTTAILNQDMADLQTMGVRATPTFFLHGKPLTNLNAEALSAAVSSAVAGTS